MQGSVDANAVALANLRDKADALQGSVNAIGAAVASHDANIGADMVAHNTNLATRANTIDANTDALQATINALAQRVDDLYDPISPFANTGGGIRSDNEARGA